MPGIRESRKKVQRTLDHMAATIGELTRTLTAGSPEAMKSLANRIFDATEGHQ